MGMLYSRGFEGRGFKLHLIMLIEQNFPLAPYLAPASNKRFVFSLH
jgi:hypothetical protein